MDEVIAGRVIKALSASGYGMNKRRIVLYLLGASLRTKRDLVPWRRPEVEKRTGVDRTNASREKRELVLLRVLVENEFCEVGIQPDTRLWKSDYAVSLTGSVGIDAAGVGFDTLLGVETDTLSVGIDTPGVGNDTGKTPPTGVGTDTPGVENDTGGVENDSDGVGFAGIYKGSIEGRTPDSMSPTDERDEKRNPPEPRTFREWRDTLEAATNDQAKIAVLVRFIRQQNPGEVAAMEEAKQNPYARVGALVKGRANPRPLKSHRTALKYLWLAAGHDVEKLIEYAQTLFNLDQAGRGRSAPVATSGPKPL